ncbi:histidinol-phosphate transaminase [candidate division LCP-89 bacterium B3_LCP]|uniref:Histidinol-phosphate aminotransferase n=1 Tax=candidate division LCP-89 bacterium B3_LCP TaxID=2012998 RepID=A0A532UYN5_UNCL8|nr:MAG: histidinol-phosphate transaminase [candidate division LCP-89 bacterium B3_LCP]
MDLARPILSEIHPYIPGKPISEVAREYGVTDIVKLASNENPLGPAPSAIKAMKEAVASLHLYPDAGGYSLVHKLSDHHDADPRGIILGNGSTEIVELICEAFLEPGGEAITGPQAFFKYRIACQIMGVQPVMVAMPDYAYDIEAIISHINPQTRLVFIANPNNPTGTYLDKSAVDRLLEALPPEAILVLDEAYYEFVDLQNYPDGLEYVKAGKRVIVLRTFSKAYGLAGIRCGYAFAHPDLIASMHKVREAFNCNALAQVAAEAALDDVNYLADTMRNNRQGLNQLETGLTKLGLEVVPSITNFVLANFNHSCDEIFVELLKRGVIIRPMGPYELPTCCRVSVGMPDEHEKLFGALGEVLERLEVSD